MRGKKRPPEERVSNVAGPLPPCRVCGEAAAGFHYGVNTCEACKGFFRRSLVRKGEYECLGKDNCPIGVNRRKSCPKCRYKRCLEVGMAKEAIKTGRYTYQKRTQDTIEIKIMEKVQQETGLQPTQLADIKDPSVLIKLRGSGPNCGGGGNNNAVVREAIRGHPQATEVNPFLASGEMMSASEFGGVQEVSSNSNSLELNEHFVKAGMYFTSKMKDEGIESLPKKRTRGDADLPIDHYNNSCSQTSRASPRLKYPPPPPSVSFMSAASTPLSPDESVISDSLDSPLTFGNTSSSMTTFPVSPVSLPHFSPDGFPDLQANNANAPMKVSRNSTPTTPVAPPFSSHAHYNGAVETACYMPPSNQTAFSDSSPASCDFIFGRTSSLVSEPSLYSSDGDSRLLDTSATLGSWDVSNDFNGVAATTPNRQENNGSSSGHPTTHTKSNTSANGPTYHVLGPRKAGDATVSSSWLKDSVDEKNTFNLSRTDTSQHHDYRHPSNLLQASFSQPQPPPPAAAIAQPLPPSTPTAVQPLPPPPPPPLPQQQQHLQQPRPRPEPSLLTQPPSETFKDHGHQQSTHVFNTKELNELPSHMPKHPDPRKISATSSLLFCFPHSTPPGHGAIATGHHHHLVHHHHVYHHHHHHELEQQQPPQPQRQDHHTDTSGDRPALSTTSFIPNRGSPPPQQQQQQQQQQQDKRFHHLETSRARHASNSPTFSSTLTPESQTGGASPGGAFGAETSRPSPPASRASPRILDQLSWGRAAAVEAALPENSNDRRGGQRWQEEQKPQKDLNALERVLVSPGIAAPCRVVGSTAASPHVTLPFSSLPSENNTTEKLSKLCTLSCIDMLDNVNSDLKKLSTLGKNDYCGSCGNVNAVNADTNTNNRCSNHLIRNNVQPQQPHQQHQHQHHQHQQNNHHQQHHHPQQFSIPKSTSTTQPNITHHSAPTADQYSQGDGPHISSTDETPPTSVGAPSPIPPLQTWPDIPAIEYTEEEMDDMLNFMVSSHRRLIYDSNSLTDEFLLSRLQECKERCSLQNEIFGKMGIVEPGEHAQIYASTGLDIDNRLESLDQVTEIMDTDIRHMIAFIKTIPGFREFSLADQTSMVKAATAEMFFLAYYRGYFPDHYIVVEATNTYCVHNLATLYPVDFLDALFKMAGMFRELKLSFETVVALKVLCVFFPDRAIVEDRYGCEVLFDKYMQCFLHQLRRDFPDTHGRVTARLAILLSDMRGLELICQRLWTARMAQYTAVTSKPILVELFKNRYPD